MVGAEIIRRFLLQVLDAARTRDRGRTEDTSSYIAEQIVQSQLAKLGIPMPLATMRAELFYLQDKALVRHHKTRVSREDYYSWRITAEGVDVLEGSRTVPGVASE